MYKCVFFYSFFVLWVLMGRLRWCCWWDHTLQIVWFIAECPFSFQELGFILPSILWEVWLCCLWSTEFTTALGCLTLLKQTHGLLALASWCLIFLHYYYYYWYLCIMIWKGSGFCFYYLFDKNILEILSSSGAFFLSNFVWI